jgi:hypothetical protein
MRRLIRPIFSIGLGSMLAVFSAALTYSVPPLLQGDFGAAGLFMIQLTSTPPPPDLSEVGSTDGIVTMGILIALIILVPILLRRKAWMEGQ